MKEIKLTQGKVAIVDDEDYEWLNKWKWQSHKPAKSNSYYAKRTATVKGKSVNILMHRLIKGVLHDSSILVDHKDKDGLNNQGFNLRTCTKKQNQQNMSSHKDSNSKYVGVGWRPNRNKFRARIFEEGKEICLGHFESEVDAARAYNEAAVKYRGEFANLNVI